jgi:uncharacterized protein involved in outer membrane biogenesis
MKILFRVGLIVIVLLVIVIVIIGSRLDSMIKSAVENIGPRITQTAVKLDGVSVSFLSGRGRISGLVIGNPEGFKTESALKLADTRVRLNVRSVTTDRVVIDELIIDGPVVTHENGPSGNNIEVIEKNIQSYGRPSSPSKAPPKDSKDKDSGHKKFQINRLLIKNGRVLMNTALTAGKTIEMPLSDIELKDIGKGSNGATIQEVSSIVLASMMKGVSQAIASIGKSVGGVAKEVGGQAGKTASGAAKNVKGIFRK